ncbi:hypothetical protein HanIR_Chr09g0413291 [Helianthus annuus]|nr:hypothetical protein HanIR_Chr09g0413291 [Helianthus annuus]
MSLISLSFFISRNHQNLLSSLSLSLHEEITKSSTDFQEFKLPPPHRRPPNTTPTPAALSFLRRPPRFPGDPQFCNPSPVTLRSATHLSSPPNPSDLKPISDLQKRWWLQLFGNDRNEDQSLVHTIHLR